MKRKEFLKCLRNEERFESPVAVLFIPLLATVGTEKMIGICLREHK
jgi:hypothetical protein